MGVPEGEEFYEDGTDNIIEINHRLLYTEFVVLTRLQVRRG